MVRCSNADVCVANFFALLIAILLIFGGNYMRKVSTNECQSNLPWTMIVVGVALLVISVLGVFGSCCRLNTFLCTNLFFMFLLIVYVITSIVLAFTISNKSVGDIIKEYNLENSSSFVGKSTSRRWDYMESCLRERKFCDIRMRIEGFKEEESYKKLSPIEDFLIVIIFVAMRLIVMVTGENRQQEVSDSCHIGCCNPPKDCGFTYMNGTHWEAPKLGFTSTNGDCRVWNNSHDAVCYGCDSCKAGVIEINKKALRSTAILDTFALAYLIVIFFIGCCALRNNRADKYERQG